MPEPSQINIVKSDATSWTFAVSDPDGIAFLDIFYGENIFSKIFKWRELASNCPKKSQFHVLKKRRFFLRSLPFFEARVVDCSSTIGAKNVVTTFRVNDQGGVRVTRVHERSADEQSLLDSADIDALQMEANRIKNFIVLFLLFLLLLLHLLWWWTFGPFFWQGH